MIDWPAFLREFGLPVTILAFFVGCIVTGLLVAGKSVQAERDAAARALTDERQAAADRLADWKARYGDEHERAVKAEARLDAALPALGLATEQLRTARQDLVSAQRGAGPG